MEEKLIDLQEFNMTDEELFSHVDNNELDSEKITAPRYSYWKSVFRVFFKNKINIVFIALLLFVIVFATSIRLQSDTIPKPLRLSTLWTRRRNTSVLARLSINSVLASTGFSAAAIPDNLRSTIFGTDRAYP